eukprot:7103425-Pyramimonas_sp.AAC.1
MRTPPGGGRNAGRCLFKTRTQHHRMVGKTTTWFSLVPSLSSSVYTIPVSYTHLRAHETGAYL